jgi:hypothetical protein
VDHQVIVAAETDELHELPVAAMEQMDEKLRNERSVYLSSESKRPAASATWFSHNHLSYSNGLTQESYPA